MAKQAASVKRTIALGGSLPTLQGPGVVRLDWMMEGWAREAAEQEEATRLRAIEWAQQDRMMAAERTWVLARLGIAEWQDAPDAEWSAAWAEADEIFHPYNPYRED